MAGPPARCRYCWLPDGRVAPHFVDNRPAGIRRRSRAEDLLGHRARCTVAFIWDGERAAATAEHVERLAHGGRSLGEAGRHGLANTGHRRRAELVGTFATHRPHTPGARALFCPRLPGARRSDLWRCRGAAASAGAFDCPGPRSAPRGNGAGSGAYAADAEAIRIGRRLTAAG